MKKPHPFDVKKTSVITDIGIIVVSAIVKFGILFLIAFILFVIARS